VRELRGKMRLIGTLIVCLFIGLGAWYGMTVYSQGSIWASNPYNQRSSGSTAHMGDISDRDGNLLAHTAADGTREYMPNENVRRALSQTVGDQMGMSGTGVENYYSSTLLNISGSLVDRLRSAFSGAERVGGSIQLTIDAELTSYIASAFPDGKKGAVCVINYRTGEVLSWVSMPNYDPVDLLDGRADDNVEDTAYLNRCLQGLYTPGSTFKIVTLAAALEADPNALNQRFTCSGSWDYEGGKIVCAGGAVHGELDLRTALAESCNVTFGKLAYQLGAERLRATAERFGLNENLKFGDFMIYNSAFPVSARNVGGLVWAGVGQGEVLVTPMHMAMIAGSVANGGMMMKPVLVKRIENSLGIATHTGAPSLYRQVTSASVADVITQSMYQAVRSGTASKAAIPGYTVCGKTGSAETSDDKSVATNAWFAGFVADPEHPYAVAVVVERGGAGGTVAAPIAQKALKKAIEVIG
jgi:peptidoglycan glycosyltransferase